ncbi:MAG: Holliday junction branch migration DNA helicase RuvB [Proteobacteria bacterium]|nr:Holliday junction branch migration DNA helicase RuvB [Pseudomonadota bacterium]
MKEEDNTFDLLAPDKDEEDTHAPFDLRPKRFNEYIGQQQIVEMLKIAVEAAQKRGEVLDHVLFYGPPGLGKTTLAHIIANEMDVSVIHTSGPALEKGGDLLSILTHLERGNVLFIDEIHRLPKVVEEFLYPAMEDFAVDIIFDKGMNARSYRSKLEQFTLVGATTRAGLLSAPLRERFGIFGSLDFYSEHDIEKVIVRSAAILNISIDEEGAREIARRSRGTPRIANRLLRRIRDYAEVRADGIITEKVADRALALEGIDALGLTPLDIRFLNVIIQVYKGGPVGLEAIAATLQEEPDTLVDMVEPFLLKAGILARTSSGRKATELAFKHLNIAPHSKGAQQMELPKL